MQWYGIIYVVTMFALGLFLTAAGYIRQRDRYWRRVWRDLGEPQVGSIKELRALSRKQNEAAIPIGTVAIASEERQHNPVEVLASAIEHE